MTARLETADPKSLEILESIRATFACKGFHGASMQDLARAADMSVGNFYRYFPSKSAIIEAMIEMHIDQVRERFAQAVASQHPLEAMGELIRHRIETVDACEGQIMAEIEANASRRAEIAALLTRMEEEITRNFIAVFAKATGLSESVTRERFSAHARLIFLLVRMSIRTSANGPRTEPDRDLAALVLKTIKRTLDEIAACAAEARQPRQELS